MAQRQLPHTLLVLDTHVTSRVRVRSWRHDGGELPHWPAGAHDSVEVAWANRGGLSYRVGRQHLHANPCEAVVIPSQVEHRTSITPGTIATSVWLSRALLAEVCELMGGGTRLDVGVVRDHPAIAQLGELMREEACTGQRGAFASTDALAEAMVVRLLRRMGATESSVTGSDPRIARAVDLVESRYAEPLTIDDLAHAAGMSRYHFSRTFSAQIGVSPYQYLVQARVRRAAELLRRRRHSVTEAAFHVGFNDLGRFARAFRNEIGCAPSAYGRARHESHHEAHETHRPASGELLGSHPSCA